MMYSMMNAAADVHKEMESSSVLVKITDCNEENNLLIGKTAQNDKVYISFEGMECGCYAAWKSMWCRRIGELEGIPLYSAEQYLDCFHKITDDFKAKRRNVYIAHLKNTTEKTAFYNIIDSNITVGVSSQSLCLTRTQNLLTVNLPKKIPIVITDVDEETGHIRGTAKYGFGGFYDNVARMKLAVGTELDGYIANQMPDGSGVCSLAPNLTTLLEPCRADRWVRVRVKKIDLESKRIKVEAIEELPYRMVDYSKFAFIPAEMPDWIDVEELNRTLRPVPRSKEALIQMDPKEAKPYMISWDEFLSTESPFATRENEQIEREYTKPVPLYFLHNEMSAGRINELHRYFAKAAATLKVATSWQLAVYVKLEHPDLEMTQKDPQKVISKLVGLSVLSKLRITSESGGMTVYYPGPQYRVLMGGESAGMPNYLLMTEDSALIKERLATNQLNFGVRKAWADAAIMSNLKVPDGERYFFVPHVAKRENKEYWMTAFRKLHYFRFEEALQDRWSQVIGSMKEKPVLMIALETEEDIKEYAPKIEALHLEFDVWLTCDKKALPTLSYVEIPAGKENKMKRFLHMFGF